MTARKTKKKPDETTKRRAPSARLVYTQAPVLLAKLIERTERGWRVDLGSVTREVAVDASVDPALLDEAHARGARAIVDASGEPAIVGVLATHRAVAIDREGRVDA